MPAISGGSSYVTPSNTHVATDNTGSEDIKFTGKKMICTLNPASENVTVLTTRPQEGVLFKQIEGL